MKKLTKIISVLLCVMLISGAFAGCTSSGSEDEITDKTMLIAYTEEIQPFLYADESGNLTGFDAELLAAAFDSFKGEYDSYKFVKVDEGYRLGEDAAYTDADGREYSAIIYCGGVKKNTGTMNEDYNWSSNIIENNVITVVSPSSPIETYRELNGAKAGVVSDFALSALEENASVYNSLESAQQFATAQKAFDALNAGSIDAVIIDDFDFYTYDGADSYNVLNGALDTAQYGFAFAKSNDYSAGFNEAVLEISSADYSESDELTPLVEKYFGYAGACVFEYESQE